MSGPSKRNIHFINKARANSAGAPDAGAGGGGGGTGPGNPGSSSRSSSGPGKSARKRGAPEAEETGHATPNKKAFGPDNNPGRDNEVGDADRDPGEGGSGGEGGGAGPLAAPTEGGGGGGITKMMSAGVNTFTPYDDGFEVTKTINVALPSPVIDVYKVTNGISRTQQFSVMHTDWNLLDWNDFPSVLDQDMLSYIVNTYTEWSPVEYGVMLDGLRVTTRVTLGSNTTYALDPSGTVDVAIRERGSIPWMMWGSRRKIDGVTHERWIGREPWKYSLPPKYGYIMDWGHSTDRLQEPIYVVERGVVLRMGSTDTMTFGGHFGESTSITNRIIRGFLTDPINCYMPKNHTEMATIMAQLWVGDLPFHPMAQAVGDLTTEIPVRKGTSKQQRMYQQPFPANSTDEVIPDVKYDRMMNCESIATHIGGDAGGQTPGDVNRHVTDPFEARPNLKSMRWVGGGSGNYPNMLMPIVVPKPMECTVHHTRLSNSCVVDQPPPQILVRLRPVVIDTDTLLNQTATLQMKLHIKWRAKKIMKNWHDLHTAPVWVSPEEGYHYTPDSGLAPLTLRPPVGPTALPGHIGNSAPLF
ncbi:VP1 protein [zander parvovirus]|uniref:VP1 protein n=1 Tax=zander parvovirus TaxID=3071220 RepID=A0AA49H241_9VIRU|nr:VP1 protein [Parvovirinae sp.]UNJ12756.1 VP1 protein [zander parvovirus]